MLFKKFILFFLTLFLLSLNLKAENLKENKIKFKTISCENFPTEYLRINEKNKCLIIQKLSNEYEVKPNDYDFNTWNRPQIIRFLDNNDGAKIITHSWNNVVEWGAKSSKQPLSHLVILSVDNIKEIFSSQTEISSSHFTLPLSLRRVQAADTNGNGNEEIIYLSNKEDGRNSNSSWKDVNYIFDTSNNNLSKFGAPHFSHDLMYLDFNNDGSLEILDYFYGDKKPGGIEVCEVKTNKCKINKSVNKFVDIGFNHLIPSKNGAIIFGGCPQLGDTTFCWSEVEYKKRKLKFKKLDKYEFRKKPKDKADFLTWTGDIRDKPGYWVEGSGKKEFKMADRSWVSGYIDFNQDGFTDSLAIEKEVVCKRKDTSKPFNRSGGDCKDEAYLYVFKNIEDSKFEKHQVIGTTINDSFRIEKADINKDGLKDIYGFTQGYSNPWADCKREQLKSVYLNKNGEGFEKSTENFIKENFGMYGCERASNFFEKDGEYYRLFITIPYAESKEAYLGIERY